MKENKQPAVSVIIPTKNRASDLETTIESLLRQSRMPAELIVIDQSPKKSFSRPIPIPTYYIHDTSIQGASAARNAGLEVAKGDIILFLDDDVVLEENFVEEIVAAFEPGIAGVSGTITNYTRPSMPRWLWEVAFVRGPFFDERQPLYWNASELLHSNSRPQRIRLMTGAVMSFRADALGPRRFEDVFPAEDIDICAQLDEGSVIVLTPRARLEHRRSPVGRLGTHWLALHAQVSYYMKERHWRRGLANNVSFAWLNVGYMVAAGLSCARNLSLKPWRSWREGAQKGFQQARSVGTPAHA